MEYLSLFNKHSDYTESAEEGLGVPNVSHCISENHVHYNPIKKNYEFEYFTVVSLENDNVINWQVREYDTSKYDEEEGRIVYTYCNIDYSLDNGDTWTTIAPTGEGDTYIATLQAGKTVMFRGTNTNYVTDTESCTKGKPSSTKTVDVCGNVMSLFHGDDFIGKLSLDSYALGGYFSPSFDWKGSNALMVVNAKDLVLPATALDNGCYYALFRDNDTLETAPELPATSIAYYSYDYMFSGCGNLHEVKCMLEDPRSGISYWMDNVSPSGTFIKNPLATWPSGSNGIPDGWTVQDA